MYKEKALNWFSSASQQVQQEITNQELYNATKIVESFENPTIEQVGIVSEVKNLAETDQLYNDLLPYAAEDFEDIRRLYSDETEDVQKEECVTGLIEKLYAVYGEKQEPLIDKLIKRGLDKNGTIKDIYNYIHHGKRGEELREYVERGIGRGVENDSEAIGKRSDEMRNTVPRNRNEEESGSGRNELSGIRGERTGEISQRSRGDGRGSRNDSGGILEVRTGEIPESTDKERENERKARREPRVVFSNGCEVFALEIVSEPERWKRDYGTGTRYCFSNGVGCRTFS